jgi:hypothetical protein
MHGVFTSTFGEFKTLNLHDSIIGIIATLLSDLGHIKPINEENV